jgi:hypothetical protein
VHNLNCWRNSTNQIRLRRKTSYCTISYSHFLIWPREVYQHAPDTTTYTPVSKFTRSSFRHIDFSEILSFWLPMTLPYFYNSFDSIRPCILVVGSKPIKWRQINTKKSRFVTELSSERRTRLTGLGHAFWTRLGKLDLTLKMLDKKLRRARACSRRIVVEVRNFN